MYSSQSRKLLPLLALSILVSIDALATTQLLLTREAHETGTDLKGVVELTVNPGFDNGKVNITVDGQKLATALRAPYKVVVDFGPRAIEHKITITGFTADGKRIQWHETINAGLHPLSVRVVPFDLNERLFEAKVTSPADDPIVSVELWDEGRIVASAAAPPYRLLAPEAAVARGFVQVTARTKSGEEAADFWSAGGEVHVESLEVRTVPLYVSVVDGKGNTLDKVDRSQFRILDNETEGKIIEFGEAFDQPISIALVLDSSASMTYALSEVTSAAKRFIENTLRDGDRCSVFAIRDVPRRMQALTGDRLAVAKGLESMTASGQTALYDSVTSAIRELKDEKNRRAIVVMTDGGDTSSISSYDDTVRASREAGIPLYFIAYNTDEEEQSKELDRLRYLSTETGGFVALASTQNLVAKYREIERDLRAQFAIRYQVTDSSKRNEWRRIRVVLNSPKLTARTIRGYYAP